MLRHLTCTLFLYGLLIPLAHAQPLPSDDEDRALLERTARLERCWLEQLRLAPADTTLAKVRASCDALEIAVAPAKSTAKTLALAGTPPQAPPPTAQTTQGATRRLFGEWASFDNPYTLTLNRPTYFVFGRQFSSPHQAPFNAALGKDAPVFENVEAKFQISLKAPLLLNVLGTPVDVMAGYTNRSFWQMFNKEISSPFRETNHEPEIWARWRTDLPFMGGNFRLFSLGMNHQSNGQSGPLSRSWNRAFAEALWEHRPFALNLRVWHRLSEDADKDDNPDIVDYLGRMQLTAIYGAGEHEFSAMIRRNFHTRQGAYQVDWSFPLYKNLRGYVQWFDGFGESLIDYNHRTRSLGVGVQLGAWLL
ncbi:MAG: phospholipase A [Gammaproteobacteria bacterium]